MQLTTSNCSWAREAWVPTPGSACSCILEAWVPFCCWAAQTLLPVGDTLACWFWAAVASGAAFAAGTTVAGVHCGCCWAFPWTPLNLVHWFGDLLAAKYWKSIRMLDRGTLVGVLCLTQTGVGLTRLRWFGDRRMSNLVREVLVTGKDVFPQPQFWVTIAEKLWAKKNKNCIPKSSLSLRLQP